MHFIENGTSGSQNIIIKQGSGATITIPPGDTKAVYLDGAGSGAAVVDAFASLSVVDLKVQGQFRSQKLFFFFFFTPLLFLIYMDYTS